MSSPVRANKAAVNDTPIAQTTSEHVQKVGWTSKFNSMGSTSMASTTRSSSTVGNVSSQVNICLECKDVVDNIGLKNTNNSYKQLDVIEQAQQSNTDDTISNLRMAPLSRETRRLHTRSLIFE